MIDVETLLEVGRIMDEQDVPKDGRWAADKAGVWQYLGYTWKGFERRKPEHSKHHAARKQRHK